MLLDVFAITRSEAIRHFAIFLLVASTRLSDILYILLPICTQSPFIRIGFYYPAHHRYYGLISQSHGFLQVSPTGYTKGLCSIWLIVRPSALIMKPFHHVAIYTSMDQQVHMSYFFTIDTSLRQLRTGLASIFIHSSVIYSGSFTTLYLSLYATS
jgi:hypothetical protein